MIVLDASVLIGHLNGDDLQHAQARALLEASDGESLGASPMTLAETLVAPARAGRLNDAQKALERLGVSELGFSGKASRRLATLRAETGLKLPDCCVLLAAEEHAGAVASFDAALNEAARRLGLDVFGE